MNSKKSQKKRRISWKWIIIAVLALSVVGSLLPEDEEQAQQARQAAVQAKEDARDAKAAEKAKADEILAKADALVAEEEAAALATETNAPQKDDEDEVVVEIKPLTKDEVLAKFEIDADVTPYIDGQFIFVGNRKDTADYYVLDDSDSYRNASVIFKDGEIARVKLIPAENQNVEKLFESFGITEKPRKMSGVAGAYEVALIPIFWSQNIERYPFELD